jgi:hypothetical protein
MDNRYGGFKVTNPRSSRSGVVRLGGAYSKSVAKE